MPFLFGSLMIIILIQNSVSEIPEVNSSDIENDNNNSTKPCTDQETDNNTANCSSSSQTNNVSVITVDDETTPNSIIHSSVLPNSSETTLADNVTQNIQSKTTIESQSNITDDNNTVPSTYDSNVTNSTSFTTVPSSNITTENFTGYQEKNQSRESRMYPYVLNESTVSQTVTSDSNVTVPAYQPTPVRKITFKSICSILNNSLQTNNQIKDIDCTVFLHVNYTSNNGTESVQKKLLEQLNSLLLKTGEFQVIGSYEEVEKHSTHYNDIHISVDRETLAYIAVASSFALVLLIAFIIFGVRCLKKRKPTFNLSRLDVKLSDYTLTRIPRVSISSTECLHEIDDNRSVKSSTMPKEKYAVISSINERVKIGDKFCHDRFLSTKELKTFKAAGHFMNVDDDQAECSKNTDLCQRSTIAYENPTFQRYF